MDTLQVIVTNFPKSGPIEEIIRIFSAALTPLIALIAIYFGYKQYRIQQYKWRSDLFENKSAIHNSLHHIMILHLSVLENGYPPNIKSDTEEDTIAKFFKEIIEHMHIVYKNKHLLRKLNREKIDNILSRGIELWSAYFTLCQDVEHNKSYAAQRIIIENKIKEGIIWLDDTLKTLPSICELE